MSNNISIKEKMLNIEEKILTRLAYKYYRSIRYEIKVCGIDEGISIYRKGLHRLNINKVKIVALVGLLAGFNALMKPTIFSNAYEVLAYIKPEYQIIVLCMIFYKLLDKEAYYFAYGKELEEALKESKEKGND